jgi:hypothetical protein
MAGFIPAVHVFSFDSKKDVDARVKPGMTMERSQFATRKALDSIYPTG